LLVDAMLSQISFANAGVYTVGRPIFFFILTISISKLFMRF
jgi:hypothetical protein